MHDEQHRPSMQICKCLEQRSPKSGQSSSLSQVFPGRKPSGQLLGMPDRRQQKTIDVSQALCLDVQPSK
ncbi:unnamed protein product [Enterobius vermicularis]|uniref:Uncharacterized protein n=1 Tax=Enterobius vermicularis TaxID=51028 RepID=A0A0N4UZ24_ENTVE|nr:unnamed protein product [Enterobius vermicularis]